MTRIDSCYAYLNIIYSNDMTVYILHAHVGEQVPMDGSYLLKKDNNSLFSPQVTSKGQRSRSNSEMFEFKYLKNGTR